MDQNLLHFSCLGRSRLSALQSLSQPQAKPQPAMKNEGVTPMHDTYITSYSLIDRKYSSGHSNSERDELSGLSSLILRAPHACN